MSNGRSGEELHRREKPKTSSGHTPVRTQRTKLQSALLSQIDSANILLSKKLLNLVDRGAAGVELQFKDGYSTIADLVVGADGIRSVSDSIIWVDYS